MTDINNFDIEKIDTQALRELGGSGEIGTTGLREASGFVMEDYLPKLRSLQKRISTFKEMGNDPTIGAVLYSIEMHLRNAEFTVTEHEEGSREQDIEFIKDALEEMEFTFPEFLSEVTSMLQYGFAVHEIVYKIKDDGTIVWSKWAPRSQDSIFEWDLNDKKDLQGVWQMPHYDPDKVYIPESKLLLFRPSTHKNNPEGRGILRSAYRPWYFKSRLETIEAIGIERSLAGYPVLNVPIQIFAKNEKAQELRQYALDIVTRVRKDEQMGSVMPPGWELSLLSTDGSGKANIDDAIDRYNLAIAQTMLADVIMIGHAAGGGSYALGDKKYELFVIALSGWMKSICSILTKKAIPKLLRLNGVDTETHNPPRIVPKPIQKLDPLALANSLFRFANINAIKPDDRLEHFLREFLGLPDKDDETERHPKAEPADYPGQGTHTAGQHQAGETRMDNVTRPTDASGEYTQTEEQNLE